MDMDYDCVQLEFETKDARIAELERLVRMVARLSFETGFMHSRDHSDANKGWAASGMAETLIKLMDQGDD